MRALRLSDDEIGRIWFEAKIPGLVESEARRLIRMAEAALAKPDPGGVCARCGGWVCDPVLAEQAEPVRNICWDMRPVAYRFRTRGVENAQWRLTDDPALIRQMIELGHWEVRPLIEAPDVSGSAA